MAAAPLSDRLDHIVEAVDSLDRLWSGKTYEHYRADPVLAAASERYLERICEAAKYVPEQYKLRFASIPWERIRGLGNRLRHAYDEIDPEIIWAIIASDLAPLRAAVTAILKELPNNKQPTS